LSQFVGFRPIWLRLGAGLGSTRSLARDRVDPPARGLPDGLHVREPMKKRPARARPVPRETAEFSRRAGQRKGPLRHGPDLGPWSGPGFSAFSAFLSQIRRISMNVVKPHCFLPGAFFVQPWRVVQRQAASWGSTKCYRRQPDSSTSSASFSHSSANLSQVTLLTASLAASARRRHISAD
jgi:hypothetical protein